MQRQFEEWASSEGLPTTYLDKHKFYESHVTDVAWQAWQASRAVIVVKLPETHNDWLDKQVVQYAIEAEGLKHE